MFDPKVALSLKRLLLVDACLAERKNLNLYLFRDENVVFLHSQSFTTSNSLI
jgi:hypothetical protein